jgi:hypothetical protein
METQQAAIQDEIVYSPSSTQQLIHFIRILASIAALGLFVAVFREYHPPVWLFVLLGIMLIMLTTYVIWHDVVALQTRLILGAEYMEVHSSSSTMLIPYSTMRLLARKRMFDDYHTIRKNYDWNVDEHHAPYTRSGHEDHNSGCWYVPMFGRRHSSNSDGCGKIDKDLGAAILLAGAFMLATAALLFLWNSRPSSWGILLSRPAARKGGGFLDRLLQAKTADFISIGAVVRVPHSGDSIVLEAFRLTDFGQQLALRAPQLFTPWEKEKAKREVQITQQQTDEAFKAEENGLRYDYRGRTLLARWQNMVKLENRAIGDRVEYGIVLNAEPALMSGAPLPDDDRLFINLSALEIAPALEDLRDTNFGSLLNQYAPQLFSEQ